MEVFKGREKKEGGLDSGDGVKEVGWKKKKKD